MHTLIPLKARYFPAIPLAVLALLLAGCGSPTPNTKKTTPTEPEQEATRPDTPYVGLIGDAAEFDKAWEQGLAQAPAIPGCQQVCRWVYDQGCKSFGDHFRVLHTDNSTLLEVSNTEVSVNWKDLRDHAMDIAAPDVARVVIMEYGMDADRHFILGIGFSKMRAGDASDWIFDDPDKMYVVKNHKLQKEPAWATYKSNYSKWIRVDHSMDLSAGYSEINTDVDHTGYAIPWETEIQKIGEQNDALDDGLDMVFTCLADNFQASLYNAPAYGDHRGYQHTMCVHVDGRLTNNPTPVMNGKSFYWAGRGGNLGTPCPPRCKQIVISALAELCRNKDICTTAENKLRRSVPSLRNH